MIRTLIKAGYGKSAFAFLTQSGQTYSFVFDDIQADLFKKGETKFNKERGEKDGLL